MKLQRFTIPATCFKTTCTIDEAWQNFRALCARDGRSLDQYVDFEEDFSKRCDIVPVEVRKVVISFEYFCPSTLPRDDQYLRNAFRGVEFALATCEQIAAGHMHDDLKVDGEKITGFVKAIRDTVLDPMAQDFPDIVF